MNSSDYFQRANLKKRKTFQDIDKQLKVRSVCIPVLDLSPIFLLFDGLKIIIDKLFFFCIFHYQLDWIFTQFGNHLNLLLWESLGHILCLFKNICRTIWTGFYWYKRFIQSEQDQSMEAGNFDLEAKGNIALTSVIT